MEEDKDLAELIARLGAGDALADELLRRWREDPEAGPKWQRLAEDTRLDEPVD
jgi:hypothetical protein